ncbi:NAD-dependent epimerase/dehydratase family protein [Paracoccus aerodenitrificans]|uniref:NAD-dependent epimerase/dehydratase family protein n=1 Tax=Paracoccus aerodenitrificans TaxID=3017781 RepID=UPI0022F0F71B|nr:NAD(P)-dependent oxidoreductase [Paracoccus aerodenitrificans]WBU62712.1 NAD(P)-dependent oxidoreductase [Paracoccus aerodenitrificans]
MSRVFITGGTGFIGSHLARRCLSLGDQVTVLARPGSDLWRLGDILTGLRIIRADPDDPRATADALARSRPEHIFLLATETRFRGQSRLEALPSAIQANVDSLQLVLTAIAQLATPPRAVIRTGTLAELSPGDPSIEYPSGIYGLSVLIGTNLLRIWSRETGIPAVTARLCLTYGGDQSTDFFVPGAISQSLAGHAEAPKNPHALRDLLHVDDIVSALLVIARRADGLPPVLNVSTGQPHKLWDVANRIAALTGQRLKPTAPAQGNSTGDIVSAPPSHELSALGWRQEIPLDAGLQQVIDWERRKLDARQRRSSL